MKNFILIATIALGLLGCASESENTGILEIANFYGCQASYTVGVSTSTNEDTKKYFEIELSDGQGINLFPAWLIGKNSALLFYNQLNEKEKTTYDQIIINVSQSINGNNSTTEVVVPTEELKNISPKIHMYEKTVETFKQENFNSFFELCSPELIDNLDKDSMSVNFNEINETYGDVKGYQVHGYQLGNMETEAEDMNVILIYGIQERDSINLNFRITLNQDEKDEQLYGFQYGFDY